jgi:hypothetical protein
MFLGLRVLWVSKAQISQVKLPPGEAIPLVYLTAMCDDVGLVGQKQL